jgi:hypothetical protein
MWLGGKNTAPRPAPSPCLRRDRGAIPSLSSRRQCVNQVLGVAFVAAGALWLALGAAFLIKERERDGRDFAETSPRCRRDVAEMSPRCRRDVAEMSPRCRREMASLIKDRRCGAPACRLRLARLQSARDRHVPAASPATQSLPRPRTLTRVRERRRTGSARGRSARRPSSPLRRARRRDSPAPPPPRSRARRSQPCASEGQGGGCRRLWL